MRCFSYYASYAACPRRLCQPPWTQSSHRKPLLLSGGTPSEEAAPQNASYSSGGGPGEALLLEKRPPPEHLRIVIHAACPRRLCQPPWTRSLNNVTLYPLGGTASEKAVPPNASYSSGGGPGEVLLLEKRPPPEYLLKRLHRRLVGQVGGNGFFKPYHVVPRVELVAAGVETTDHGVA